MNTPYFCSGYEKRRTAWTKCIFRGQNGNPVYDFSNVNKVFGEYVKRGLKPVVEYDYLPKQLENKTNKGSNGNDEGMKMKIWALITGRNGLT